MATVSPTSRSSGLGGYEVIHPRRAPNPVGDVDGDGIRDIAFVSVKSPFITPSVMHVRIYSPANGALLMGHADAEDSQDLGPVPFPFNDVDGDGIQDLFLGTNSTTDSITKGTVLSGATGATLVQLPPNPGPSGWLNSMAIADMDGDGSLDIVQQYGQGVRALSGASFDVLFTTAGDTSISSINGVYSVGDLDRDGLDDMIAATRTPQHVTIMGYIPSLSVICTGEPHSAGLGARLRPMGSTSVAANALTLEAWNLPPTSFALLLNSSGTVPAIGPGSIALGCDGNLCLAPASLARRPWPGTKCSSPSQVA